LEQKDDTLRSVLTPEQFDVYTNAKDELKQALQQDLKHWSPLLRYGCSESEWQLMHKVSGRTAYAAPFEIFYMGW